MRRAVPLLALLAACGGDETPRPGPAIAFEATRHEFGAVEPGDALRHGFAFRNGGGRPLRIDAVRATCDCRATASPADAIAPGASGVIDVECDTGVLAGPQRRTVTVYANDAARPVTTLALEADVRADVAAVPPQFYFGRARAGRRTRRDLRLLLADPTAVPRRARSEGGSFAAALERRSDAEWRVALTLAGDAPPGVLRDRIVIDTASPRQPQIVVPVTGVVEPGE